MKTTKLLYLIPAAMGLSLAGANADTACSPPIGFNKVTIKGDADTHISVPFHQKPVFTGALSSNPSTVAITVDDQPDTGGVLEFSGADFSGLPAASTLYVRFTTPSAPKEGFWYQVHENTATTVTIRLNGDSIAGVVSGHQVTIIPHWTFGTLFTVGTNALTASTSRLAFINRGSEILIPFNENLELNKASDIFFYYGPDSQWEKDGFTGSVNDQVIPPNAYVIVRHPGADFQFCADGRVPTSMHAVQIDVGTVANDNLVSVDRPIDISLDESGIVKFDGSGDVIPGSFVTSSSELAFINRGDELLIVDNDAAGFNKAADIFYFLDDGVTKEWRKDGVAGNAGIAKVLKAGQTFVIRKKAAGSTATQFVENDPTY